jgi:hypothetical protein
MLCSSSDTDVISALLQGRWAGSAALESLDLLVLSLGGNLPTVMYMPCDSMRTL